MRIRRASDYKVMTWKNGGGSTTEVEVWPAGATLDGFDWRLSMARIEADGPFSSFPGIDRTLTLLDGGRVDLEVEGKPVALTPDRPTLRFAGEDNVTSTIPAGPIIDFNVMTRRARCRHAFHRFDIAGSHSMTRKAGTTILFLARGPALSCRAETAGGAHLGARDCLILEAGDPLAWHLDAAAPATIFQIEIA